jgi:hypothetical protein
MGGAGTYSKLKPSARRFIQQQIKDAFLGRIPTKLRDLHPIERLPSPADHRSSQKSSAQPEIYYGEIK